MHGRDHLYNGQGVVPNPGVVPVGADHPARLVIEAAWHEADTHADLRRFQPRFRLMHDPRFVEYDVETAGFKVRSHGSRVGVGVAPHPLREVALTRSHPSPHGTDATSGLELVQHSRERQLPAARKH